MSSRCHVGVKAGRTRRRAHFGGDYARSLGRFSTSRTAEREPE